MGRVLSTRDSGKPSSFQATLPLAATCSSGSGSTLEATHHSGALASMSWFPAMRRAAAVTTASQLPTLQLQQPLRQPQLPSPTTLRQSQLQLHHQQPRQRQLCQRRSTRVVETVWETVDVWTTVWDSKNRR